MATLPQEYTQNTETSKENNFEPVPGGIYRAVIEESSISPNKSNTGENLKLVWLLIEGPLKDRKIFENVCIKHSKTDTQMQAIRTLNNINDLCGFPAGKRAVDTTQLHNIPMLITVKCVPDSDFPNSITKHESDGKAPEQPTQTKTAPVNAGVDNNNAATKHPWEK